MLILLTVLFLVAGTALLVLGVMHDSIEDIYLSIACALVVLVLFFISVKLSRRRARRRFGRPPDTSVPAATPVAESTEPQAAASTPPPPVTATAADSGGDLARARAWLDEQAARSATAADEHAGPGEGGPGVTHEGWADETGWGGDTTSSADTSAAAAEDTAWASDTTGRAGTEPGDVARLDGPEVDRPEAAAVVDDAETAETWGATDEVTPGEDDAEEGDEVEPAELWGATENGTTGEAAGADEHVFPIADYDELRVDEIVPLLEELYPDELREVRDRELATKARLGVLRPCALWLGEPMPQVRPKRRSSTRDRR